MTELAFLTVIIISMGCLGWEMFRAIAVLFLDEGVGINIQERHFGVIGQLSCFRMQTLYVLVSEQIKLKHPVLDGGSLELLFMYYFSRDNCKGRLLEFTA